MAQNGKKYLVNIDIYQIQGIIKEKRKIMENTAFVCFTSACGGSGCTSSAVALARICSKLKKEKVLVISLDILSSKMFPLSSAMHSSGVLSTGLTFGKGTGLDVFNIPLQSDEFGVSYACPESFFNPLHSMSETELSVFLSALSSSGRYDLVILDIPFAENISERLCMCCEKIVVVTGYLPYQRSCSRVLLNRFEKDVAGLEFEPLLFEFAPAEDRDSFSGEGVDIHDQFGAEVRQLAEELFSSF